MSAFNKIIGYENIKKELQQICDMIHNKSIYDNIGAKLPHGMLLYGKPGLGKTLMANCFIEESNLQTYTLRKNKGAVDFINEITTTFNTAKDNAPCIIFMDDMDKFANEDENYQDCEEYITVQAGIDEVKDYEVFVLATANDINKLPSSLIRSGRFDRKIEISKPSTEDARDIIQFYLKDKKISKDLNLEDVSMMINYNSCAELETLLNEAAINAAFAKRTSINIDDIVTSFLKMKYSTLEEQENSSVDEMKKIALHEAGHLVVCEILCPNSVGIAALLSNSGFIRRCKHLSNKTQYILVALAGKVAIELYYADTYSVGCKSDLLLATQKIQESISDNASSGLNLLDISNFQFPNTTENYNFRNETVVYAELERYMMQTRDILLKNRKFLEEACDLLLEKKVLLYSDIKALREKYCS